MSYPTMPRPSDNTGDNHRAAIAVLEEGLARNAARTLDQTEVRNNASRNVDQAMALLAELADERASLQRGIDALKGMDQ